MTATCFSYVHVLHKKAAFIPDASIGVFSPQFYNKNTPQTDHTVPPPVLCFSVFSLPSNLRVSAS